MLKKLEQDMMQALKNKEKEKRKKTRKHVAILLSILSRQFSQEASNLKM